MTIRALDLFCGAGGSSWGAREAGVSIVAAFDLWRLAGEAHRVNFPETTFIDGRLENITLPSLKRAVGKIDLILASPECTNHSLAKGNKPRSNESKDTAFQVIRFAECFRPRWVVVENVTAMRQWNRYPEFKQSLELLGYHIREQVLNASDFGVPQSRKRLFLIADRRSLPSRIVSRSRVVRSAADVVDLGETYNWTPLETPRRAVATLNRAERGIDEVGKKTPFLIVYYGSDYAGGWQRLNRPLRTITTLDRFAIVKPDRDHGHLMRMLQVPELQAAMGMPKKMKLEVGTRRDRIKMIGNAVCPPVMKHIIRALSAA